MRTDLKVNDANFDDSSTQLSQSAFTLLELLVVIAIIAILVALLVGGLSRAKLSAQRVGCMNNLKQWGYAAHLYAHDNDDALPRESAVDGINSWEMTTYPTNNDVWYNALAKTTGVPTMASYAQTPSSQHDFYANGKIFHCPGARFSPVAATYPNFSLAINSKLMRDFEGRAGPTGGPLTNKWAHKLGEIKVPGRTAFFLDNGIPGEKRLCAFQLAYTAQPKTFASEFPGRHNRGGNILFFDAHVVTLAGKDVVEMNAGSVNRGRAIFPGEVIWRHDPELVP
jgi:prepilin-type N-terminal cleavage/methylation domain-containing protein/prepilin-type processing-associated H-X9-DG protein